MDTKRGENFETEPQTNINPPAAETEGDVEFVPDEEIERGYETILHDHPPVNFGKEAIIYYLSKDELPPAIRRSYMSSSGRETSDAAMKVIKVYKPGHAEREFAWQQKAYDVIEDYIAANPEQAHMFARVPAPIEKRTITISEETKRTLNTEGAQLQSDKVEILVMDFVNGEDLLEKFYRWVIKHAPEDKQYAVIPDPDKASFHMLQQSVGGILGFGRYEDDIGLGYAAELDARRHKLYAFLQKTGFRLPQNIVNQKRNTRRLLEQNGIFHNDDHERNSMVDGDQLYLIDFSKADKRPPEDEAEFHLEVELEKLTPDYEQKLLQQQKQEQQFRFSSIRNNTVKPSVETAYKIVVAVEDDQDLFKQRIANRGIAATANDKSLEDFMSLLVRLVDEKKINSQEALTFIEGAKRGLVVQERIGRNRQLVSRVTNPHIYNKIDSYRPLFH
jgi:hypothetical protein